ncbi:hypothetical protein [Kitasatospora herbaricolor]|uniref:Uncharacterized protein n=1 Tax=Kitasatospora herbaricolor TaxID=68217 RepID=A0ABZ1WME4_9ACTN|nr:hypothetical protein [Kitasatospora herbaricolor]
MRVDDRGWMGGEVYGEPIPGAIDALRLLARHRAVFIYTARGRRTHQAVADRVARHSGLATRVNTDLDTAYWLGCDKAVHFDGDWTATLPVVTRAIGLDPATVRPSI